MPASEEIPDTIPPCPDGSGEGGSAPHSLASRGNFFWRQLSAAGLTAIAEKVVAGRSLELDEVLVLSRASLPLLGKLIQLRSNVPTMVPEGDAAAVLFLVERVDSRPTIWPPKYLSKNNFVIWPQLPSPPAPLPSTGEGSCYWTVAW